MTPNVSRFALWLAASLVALSLTACGADTETEEPAADATPALDVPAENAAEDTTPAVLPPMEGPVAATVAGLPVTVGEVQRVAYNLRRQGLEPDEEIQGADETERLYRTAMKRLIEQRVIQKAGTERGIVVTQGDLFNGVERVKSGAGGDAAFQAILDENKSTMSDVQRDVMASIYIRELFGQVVGDAQPPVSAAEIQKFYDENPQHFASSKEIHCRHILLLTQPDMDDMAKAEVRNQLKAILDRVRGGEDFATVANETTQDPTNGGKGGDLGWFKPGVMVPPFNDAAFALKDGQISDIVETQFGYHIIKKEGERMSDPTPLAQVSPQIEQYLAQQKAQETFQAFIDSLATVYDVKIEPVTPEALSGF